jgi:uncharacterized membrane protein YidH (DUF202 family)
MVEKNNYIKLFEKLSLEKPNTLVSIKQFEDLGFFMTDFQLLDKKEYVILDEHKEKNKIGDWIINFYVKLAPKGFESLENFNKTEEQERFNYKTLKATIIIALATALNVFIVFSKFLFDFGSFGWATFILLLVLLIVIGILIVILGVEMLSFMFQIKRNKK